MNTSNQAVESSSTTCRIKVDRGVENFVPPSVWATKPFKFDPSGFIPESKYVEQKVIEASAQWRSLEAFAVNPKRPMIYVVTGNPEDSKAKYFAAYLVALHCRAVRAPNVVWEVLTSGWESPALKADSPTMLVMSNLADGSSKFRMEKARDLIEKWSAIPRVVVAAGEDPISFATRMRIAAHGVAYFWSKNNKIVQEII